MSVAAAFLVGGIEALGLLGNHFGLDGGFWAAIVALNSKFDNPGFVIVRVFLAAWTLSYLIYRIRRIGLLEVQEV